MEIFCPTRAFNSVDFPAFGRPMMVTVPDFMSNATSTRHALPIASSQEGMGHVQNAIGDRQLGLLVESHRLTVAAEDVHRGSIGAKHSVGNIVGHDHIKV